MVKRNVSTLAFSRKRPPDRKSTRLNSSHSQISYAVLWLKKKCPRCCGEPWRQRRLRSPERARGRDCHERPRLTRCAKATCPTSWSLGHHDGLCVGAARDE